MSRKNIILKNVSVSVVFKILNMGIVFLTIPLLLNYLDKELYGVWVTIFSIISILFFADAGIANGLKTKLSKAISDNNIVLSREYISTGYFSIFVIAVFFFGLGNLFLNLIDLKTLLNISEGIEEAPLNEIFLILLIFISSSLVLSLYKTLFFATHKAAAIEISIFIYQFLVFIFIFYAVNNLSSSLKYVAIIYGSINIFVGILFSILFFIKNKELVPKLKFFKWQRLKELMSLSINFFIIQLCMIVIFTTDNLLISNLLGPKEVANYDVVLKLFQVVITVSAIGLEPFWALFSDAYQKKDINWIRSTFKRMNYLFLGIIVGVIILVIVAEDIIKIWVGNMVQPQAILIYAMGIFVLVRLYAVIYMMFLNGIGEIKLQMWLYIVGAIINIPLSIYLVQEFHLGSTGIIIGTILSILALTLLLPIQSYKILKRA